MHGRGLIVAAPSSGSGKTLVALALARALKRRGFAVAAAKLGPDYLDTAYLAAATGRACLNLDPWAMRETTLTALVQRLAADADRIVCEGVMGLFDGVGPAGEGSTGEFAARSGFPIVLVVDVAGQAASAAALVAGFATYRPDVAVAAVIFNRVGGPRHADLLHKAMAARLPRIPVLACLPREKRLAIASRHLGLLQAREITGLDTLIERGAEWLEAHGDVSALSELARAPRAVGDHRDVRPLAPLGQNIWIAEDDAFAFAYPAVIDGWRRAGAGVHRFSPLADEAPPHDADAVYLPGGYPELHAGLLAGNRKFLGGLHAAAAKGGAIYGECGGYMVLGRGLVDREGAHHAMAGLLPVETSFARPRLALGYRELRLDDDGPLGAAGQTFRGHEFHYATLLAEDPAPVLFVGRDAGGHDVGTLGRRVGKVMGSFIHLIDRVA